MIWKLFYNQLASRCLSACEMFQGNSRGRKTCNGKSWTRDKRRKKGNSMWRSSGMNKYFQNAWGGWEPTQIKSLLEIYIILSLCRGQINLRGSVISKRNTDFWARKIVVWIQVQQLTSYLNEGRLFDPLYCSFFIHKPLILLDFCEEE